MASPDERPAHPLYVGYTLALVTCAVAGLVQGALQPILGGIAIALLAVALVLRLRGDLVCPAPARTPDPAA